MCVNKPRVLFPEIQTFVPAESPTEYPLPHRTFPQPSTLAKVVLRLLHLPGALSVAGCDGLGQRAGEARPPDTNARPGAAVRAIGIMIQSELRDGTRLSGSRPLTAYEERAFLRHVRRLSLCNRALIAAQMFLGFRIRGEWS
jgi:hypothetical protein